MHPYPYRPCQSRPPPPSRISTATPVTGVCKQRPAQCPVPRTCNGGRCTRSNSQAVTWVVWCQLVQNCLTPAAQLRIPSPFPFFSPIEQSTCSIPPSELLQSDSPRSASASARQTTCRRSDSGSSSPSSSFLPSRILFDSGGLVWRGSDSVLALFLFY